MRAFPKSFIRFRYFVTVLCTAARSWSSKMLEMYSSTSSSLESLISTMRSVAHRTAVDLGMSECKSNKTEREVFVCAKRRKHNGRSAGHPLLNEIFQLNL